MTKKSMTAGALAAREETVKRIGKVVTAADEALTTAVASGDQEKIKEAASRAFGTHQWADQTVNCIRGCKCDCLGCFAADRAYRFKEKAPGQWKCEVLNERAYNAKVPKGHKLTMFPSTHNISPEFLGPCEDKIQQILDSGSDILIVLKPWLEVVESICTKFKAEKDRIIFRFTIGSTDNDVLKFWEPGAPSFEERMACLQYAFEHGFETSVSCEPWWGGDIDSLISELRPFVTDSIWIGKMNRGKARMKNNGHWNPQTEAKYNELMSIWYADANIMAIYDRYKDDSLIRWKESIAKVVGAVSDCKD